MRQFLKDMFSESNSVSSMRICVMLIVGAYLFNWTFFNLAHGQLVSFEIKDLIGLLGALSIKLGQKRLENKQ